MSASRELAYLNGRNEVYNSLGTAALLIAACAGTLIFAAPHFQLFGRTVPRTSTSQARTIADVPVQRVQAAQEHSARYIPAYLSNVEKPVLRSLARSSSLELDSTNNNAVWVITALTSLMFNGMAAALLFIAWRTGATSSPAFAMAATASETAESEPSGNEDDAAYADEQAESPTASLELELEELKAKLSDSEKKYLYLLAEMETVRRRSKQQVEDAQKFGVEKFALAMLEVADNMARGLAWVPKEVAEGPSGDENPNPGLRSLYGGMRSTEKIMMNILEKQGIQKYDPLGEIYDPALSRAIAQVPSADAEPGTVLQVVSAGYVLNGRVLRPADVVVVQEES